MSRGKYSPTVYGRKETDFSFNAKGEVPPETWTKETYSEEIHFGNYDKEGFDRYGYSAYDSEGKYLGIGGGVDRNGITEYDYLCMTDEQFEQYL